MNGWEEEMTMLQGRIVGDATPDLDVFDGLTDEEGADLRGYYEKISAAQSAPDSSHPNENGFETVMTPDGQTGVVVAYDNATVEVEMPDSTLRLYYRRQCRSV